MSVEVPIRFQLPTHEECGGFLISVGAKSPHAICEACSERVRPSRQEMKMIRRASNASAQARLKEYEFIDDSCYDTADGYEEDGIEAKLRLERRRLPI